MIDAKYEIIDGIKCYSPELALENTNFQSDGFEYLFNVEEQNFWFRSRNKIITHLFKKYLGTEHKKNILEIGCGTGFVLSALSKFENYHLTGAEIYLEGIKFAKRRLSQIEFVQLDATKLPFENQFDAIGAFDVIEHIENDELVMRNIFKALKKGGKLFVSVPQYRFLWSITDDIACHKRRYSKKELVDKIEKAGFTIEYVGSFVTTLFPAMYLSRLSNKKRNEKTLVKPSHQDELELNPILNKVFAKFMKIDEFFIKSGISLPYGGSLILVGKK